MSEAITINATRRSEVGKGAARAARRAGQIPGIVYGAGADPVAIALEELALNRLLGQPGFFSHLFQLDVAGEKMNVLARDLQVHPVTDRAMHVDFLRVSTDTVIAIEVPAVFLNEDDCPGLREGGILNIVRHAIELYCRPDAIPEQIEVDLTGYEVGDSIHISAIKLPAGVEPTITDRDFTVATIAAPAKMADAAEAEDDGESAKAAESDED